MFIKILENLFLTFGGITIFLHGLQLMSENVQALAGNKMKGLLSVATGSPIKGVLAGAGVTAIIQSSTATNIMLVSFVNAGALSILQAVSVVMGANIGTTVTAQLVSLSGSNIFNITAFGSLVALVGFLFGFTSNKTANRIGRVMLGFGCLFIGLEIMNTSVFAFKDYPFFRRLFMVENPLLLVLNGLLITGIVQSSSAVSSVMIVLAINGLITFEGSMYLILGTNIGAGIAVLLVSSTMTREAKKVAVANMLFNVVGTLIVLIILVFWEEQIARAFALSGGIERQIANFHTLFNTLVAVLLLPLLKPFVKLVDLLTPNEERRKKNPTKNCRIKIAK